MRYPAMLIALLLPACGEGLQGIAVPPPLDFARIERPKSPNTALAAPEGFQPPPDIVTRPYEVSAARLYAAVSAVAAAQPRTFPLKAFDDRLQAHFVARSTAIGFPDLIAVQAFADGPDRSTVALWSRSVYGYSDFGVNRRRVAAWLAALDAKVGG